MKIKNAGIVGVAAGSAYNDTLASAAAVSALAERLGIEVKKTAVAASDALDTELAGILSKYDCALIVGAGATAPAVICDSLCRLLKCTAAENDEAVALQRSFHHKRGHGRPEYCAANSRLPQTAVPILASKTAEAGYILNLEKAGKAIIVLPGPASAISSFAEAGLEGYLADRSAPERYSLRVNLVACNLKQLAAEARLLEEEEGVSAEIFPMTAETALVITADSERRCKKALKRLTASEVGDSVYGTDTDLATEIVRILTKQKKTVSFAESCTGGLLASMLVAVPGSSEVFDGSLITYANQIKHDYLEVRASTLESEGAVSRKCAAQMAEGARRAMHADFGVGITGIAGPGGGSPEKPVGLVYVAVSERGESASVHKFNFHGSRSDIRAAAAAYALRELYRVIRD